MKYCQFFVFPQIHIKYPQLTFRLFERTNAPNAAQVWSTKSKCLFAMLQHCFQAGPVYMIIWKLFIILTHWQLLVDIVYSKLSMYPILDCFVNTRILSVYENIDSSICQKIISSNLFSGHHNVYESDSDQIISSNVDNNNVSNKLNNLCSLEIKYDVS